MKSKFESLIDKLEEVYDKGFWDRLYAIDLVKFELGLWIDRESISGNLGLEKTIRDFNEIATLIIEGNNSEKINVCLIECLVNRIKQLESVLSKDNQSAV